MGEDGPPTGDRPDRAPVAGPGPPGHRRPGLVALVVLGGTAGTATRAWLEAAVPSSPGRWPWATFAVNVTGALVLGVLLESLLRRGPDTGWRRGVRLAAGTGFLGGYTTYSTFALEIVEGVSPHPWLAALYGLTSVSVGLAAAGVGLRVASVRWARHRAEDAA